MHLSSVVHGILKDLLGVWGSGVNKSQSDVKQKEHFGLTLFQGTEQWWTGQKAVCHSVWVRRSCLTWICELAMASKNTQRFLDPSLKLYHWVLPLINDNSNVHFPHPLSCHAYLNGKLMLTLIFCWVLIQHFCTARPCFGLRCCKQLRNECSAGEATDKPIQPSVLSPAALGDCA